MKVAVIGMGSNSLRMLVSEVDKEKNKIKKLFKARDGLRVFAALKTEHGGKIAESMINHAACAIENMKNIALELGCKEINLFATSATRDASNKEEFLAQIYKHTGLNVEIISGEMEAEYSFIGASMGLNSAAIDIGGGSCEFAIGSKDKIDLAYSYQLGAVRLYRMQPITCIDDMQAAVDKALDILNTNSSNIQNQIDLSKPKKWFGVGGSFTSLSAIAQNISWSQYDKIDAYVLNQDLVYQMLCKLSSMTMEERMKHKSIQNSRSDIIANGVAAIYACMKCFNIKDIEVSTRGNLDGYLIKKYLY